MDVEKLFHMTGGAGPTSYAKNSYLQKNVSDMVKHITLETLQELYLELTPKTISIADLGCSSGPNSLATIKAMVETIEKTDRKSGEAPEFYVYLNDLPTNDFNSVFKALPDFYRQLSVERNGACPFVFISGCPGSFYGRLLPKNSLHFIYSSNSLHWLSKVPPGIYNEEGESVNKGNIYISESSPPVVSMAYFNQFQEDFSLFLGSRSKELVVGGRMVLILLGRLGPDHVDRGNYILWELLSQSLANLASQGKIEKEKFESYHAHFYAPSKEEIEEQVRREGSFKVDQFQMFQPEKKNYGGSYGSAVAMAVRAIQESMLRHHFGVEDEVLDTLFQIFSRLMDEEMAKEEIKAFSFLVVLKKL
ncbi:hypothetical protein EZV62_014268 [Acer yangbiense]|uniref:Jasmonate O-methyltransferase n=1 Tax=Acer yangbiense TaxID=1000413 RepID=A0A5C7HS75_9ROSI|nr:hypothetical protein EZV62_014268 [Acer yangbiense]